MRTLLLVPAAFAVVLSAAGCNTDPSKDKPKATVAEPAASVTTTNAIAGAKTLTFSEKESKVSWVGAKITRKHDGGFDKFNGTVQLVDGNAEKSTVTVVIDIGSLRSDEEKLSGHLKTGDFFDVAKFPKATFTSTAIKAGAAGATHTVTGNLELHGVTKALSFPATIKITGDAADVSAEFAINRKDFSLAYPGKPDDLIKDEVLVKLDVHAKKP